MELLSLLLVFLGVLLVRAGLRRRKSGERSGIRLVVLGAVLSGGSFTGKCGTTGSVGSVRRPEGVARV